MPDLYQARAIIVATIDYFMIGGFNWKLCWKTAMHY